MIVLGTQQPFALTEAQKLQMLKTTYERAMFLADEDDGDND